MNYMNDVSLSVIFLLFPIMAYIFYIAYNKNVEKEENKLVLCFALFSSIYLILGKDWIYYTKIALSMASIAIIIAYIRKCPYEAILLSIFYIFIVNYKYSVDISFLIIEYTIWYLIYLLKERYDVNDYIYVALCFLLKMIISVFLYNNLYYDSNIMSTILVFLITLFIIMIIKRGDSILTYHIAYKELIQEKQIRTSLFKITHEIKNPLAVCKGYFEMLDVDNVKHCKKYLPIIRNEIEHTLLILNDFSDLSKIKIEKDIIDICFVLEEIIDNLRELLNNQNIKITLKSEDDIYIDGDYTRLMQVFINVIKNSIEALDEQNNKKIEIEIKEDDNDVTVRISDNGIGMSNELLKEFDKPFYTTKKNGTGLGTTLSKEIIEAHDGAMEYKSTINKGTTVIITLPKTATSFD